MKHHKNATVVIPSADERLLTSKELLQRVPLNRATIWRMVQEGRFPPPIQITANRIVWRWSAVLSWLADRESNPVEPRAYFGRAKAGAAVSVEPASR